MSESVLNEPKPPADQLSWGNIVRLILILTVLAGIGWVYFEYFGIGYLNYVIVFSLGGLLGLTEIVGRYTDSPTAALKSPGAFVYVLVNGFASAVALYLILEFAPDIANPITQVLLAGLGAMAFLRSALFKAKVGDQDVAIGPAIILDTLLKFADAQVDRGRAVDRASRIASIIGALSVAKAGSDLPLLCFALMQNLPADVRQRLLDDITLVVTDAKRSEPVKVMEIGLVLWNRVGIGTLMGAVELLKKLPPVAEGAAAAVAGAAAKEIVPRPPHGRPEDLLAEISKQFAKDREIGSPSASVPPRPSTGDSVGA